MRLAAAVVFVLFISCLAAPERANGRQPYFDAFKEKYAPDAESAYGKLVNTTKCNVCHIDKMPKTKRNVYGIALSKIIAKNEKDKGKINEALGKVGDEKSPSGK